jgi:hypothetical protein
MRYALLMYADPERTTAMTADELDEVAGKHAALRDELMPTGVMVGGAGLVLPHETTTLRWKGPTTTGPFLGGRDQLTAYYELECGGEEQAREIARRVLDFHVVAVELRRIHDRVDLEAGGN